MRTTHERFRLRTLGRGLMALMLVVLILGMSGGILGMLSWLGPVPSPQFVGVWIDDGAKPQLTPDAAIIDNPDTTRLLAELARWRTLPARDGLIAYINAPAMTDARGGIHIVPADASIDRPLTWVALKEVLEALRTNPAKNKLVILDIVKRQADPCLGALHDDVMDGLPKLLDDVPDPGRLVLCACAAGQEAPAADGSSLFGHYLQEGLYGHADGHGVDGRRDGFVSVRELAAFLHARVDRAAQSQFSRRQTPVLFGDADDFALAALPRRRTREQPAPVELTPYPQWLQSAWRERDALQEGGAHALSPRQFQRRQAVLLDAERAWRKGHAQREQAFQAKFAQLRKEITGNTRLAAYERTSLAGAGRTQGPYADSVAAVQDVLARFKQQAAGLSSKDRSDLAARLLDGFRLKIKDAAPEAVVHAIWDEAAQRPEPDALDLLDQMARALTPSPRHVELLLVRQLADLGRRSDGSPWPKTAVQHAVQAALAGEKWMRPDMFPRVRGQLTHAAQARHDGEMLLWARGFADPASAARRLKQATELYRDIDKSAAPILAAQDTLNRTMVLLPWFPHYLEHDPGRFAAWEEVARHVLALQELLRSGMERAEESRSLTRNEESPLDDTSELMERMRRLCSDLGSLMTQFEVEGDAHLESLARSPRADGGTYRRFEALLAVPVLKADARVRMACAARDLAERLRRATVELDRHDDASAVIATTPRPAQAAMPDRDSARRRARISLTLAELGGVDRQRLEPLCQAMRAAQAPADWIALGNRLRSLWAEQLPRAYREAAAPERVRLSWVAPPRSDYPVIDDAPAAGAMLARKQAESWWEFASSHYLYQARDYQGAGLDGEGAVAARQFYQQAAFANSALHQPSMPETLVIRTKQMPKALSFSSPETRAVLEFRSASATRAPGPIRFDALRPAANWLDVSPDAFSFASFSARASKTVPLRVRLKPREERGRGARPSGFLVQASYAERHFHFVVPVVLEAGPDDLQVLLGTQAGKPDPNLRQIRLRAGNVPQPYYLFAKNPTSRPRLVHVQVRAADRVLTETGTALRLPADDIVPVPLQDMNGGGYADVKGPLQLVLLDAEDQKRVLDARQVALAIASPSEYVRVEDASLTSAGVNQHGFSVRLQTIAPPTGAPIPAELILPARLFTGLKGPAAGTLRGELAPHKAGSLTLFAERLNLPDEVNGEDVIHVDVDGVSRAFSFRLKWGSDGVFLVPQDAASPRVSLGLPPFVAPNKSYRFPLAVDRAPPGSTLEVRLGHIGHGGFEAEATRVFAADRNRRIDMHLQQPRGPSHAIVFRASEHDWIVDFDLSKVAGQRLLQARLIDDLSNDVQQAMQAVTIDGSVPTAVRFLGMPARAKCGTTLQVKATAEADSGIASVTWFVGRPLQGKIPEGTRSAAGKPPAADSRVWTGRLSLPNRVGPVEISALIANRVGKAVFATTVIELTEIEPAMMGNGTIEGRVLESGRPQPDLEVILEDDSGRELGRAATGRDGTFRFEEIAPGRYTLRSFKPASGRRGAVPATVAPNQSERVTISLFL